ncbi:serpin family protein [Arthrobacter agilis]|uniref:serpin family protein n=1 Tax=Arthrobacter agilis TaxID=37921 RepID=UPI00236529E4|nr:serpin family protein [Arthrobacter agilis]WDF34303.1 serpin family protein [Arthrobacter agilis]
MAVEDTLRSRNPGVGTGAAYRADGATDARIEPRSPRRTARSHTSAAAIAAGGLLLLTACGASPPEQEAAQVERIVVRAGQYPDAEEAILRSSFRIGAALTAEPTANQVTSPLSALYALSMLRAGAGTTTAAEMDAVLGLPVSHRDEAMNALLVEVQRFDGDPGDVDDDDPPRTPLLHLANGVFVAESGRVGEPFLEVLAQHYGSGVYPVDFGESSTADRIDAWISKETGGRVVKAPLPLDRDTVLSLLTTVYFAAGWEQPFEHTATADATFTLADGTAADVPTMHATPTVRYARGENWTGIDLPYGEGFFMRLVLPDAGVAPAWTEDGLSDIAAVLDDAEAQPVDLALPSWDHAYGQDLIPVLTALGLEESLGPAPDFDAIIPGAVVTGAGQSSTITVAEKGTVAAAVTQITMAETAAPMIPELSIAFDRPFGYQIIHEDTGLPIFLGTVADPRP